MNIKKIALGSAAAVMALGTVAQASVIDRPFFKVLGTVVVWSAPDASTAGPVVHDFILGTTGSPDLIAADGHAVVTGTLTPLDQSAVDSGYDATSAAALTISDAVDSAAGEYASSFYVASNTEFNIKAHADDFAATGDFALDNTGAPITDLAAEYADNISLEMGVTTSGTDAGTTFGGTKAQAPYTTADSVAFNGFQVGGTKTLSDLGTTDATAVDVFVGDQRTAAAAGSILQQSVRFDALYNLTDDAGDAFDMSMGFGELSARVTYTVYVP